RNVTGVQTCALPIYLDPVLPGADRGGDIVRGAGQAGLLEDVLAVEEPGRADVQGEEAEPARGRHAEVPLPFEVVVLHRVRAQLGEIQEEVLVGEVEGVVGVDVGDVGDVRVPGQARAQLGVEVRADHVGPHAYVGAGDLRGRLLDEGRARGTVPVPHDELCGIVGDA